MQTQGVRVKRNGLMAIVMGAAMPLLLVGGATQPEQVSAVRQVIGADRQDDLAWG